MKKRILAILSVLAISLCCVLAACQSEKDLTLSGYDKDGLELIEYDKAYAPFWEGTTVYNESCVFIKGEDHAQNHVHAHKGDRRARFHVGNHL